MSRNLPRSAKKSKNFFATLFHPCFTSVSHPGETAQAIGRKGLTAIFGRRFTIFAKKVLRFVPQGRFSALGSCQNRER
jgi:hypothetical protein